MPELPAPTSYASGTADLPLLGETIGGNLDRTVARIPANEALVDLESGRRWTYAELAVDVDRLARGLLAMGVAKGDRVGIWAPNCPEWVLVQYATAKVGAILVNVNPAYRTHELSYVLKQSGVGVLVTAESFRTSDYVAMVAEVRGDCPDLREVVVIGTPSWDALVAGADAVDDDALHARSADLSFDDPINIQYTSGTTGFPKGATLSHHNILNNGYFVAEMCGFTEDDVVVLPVPFYHCFGMVMGNLGSTS
ncbi:MAG TPA: AMP-binding protein, partial [Actinomycetes bacterium]